MNFDLLEKFFLDEPMRLKQARRAVGRDLIESWKEAMVLPLAWRERLEKEIALDIRATIIVSADGNTRKAAIFLADGQTIETVLMRHRSSEKGVRHTVCASSQIGCALGCAFCATGRMGFVRNLSAGEIVEQVVFWARQLKKENEKVGNAVFMGMGEPFMNYDNVLAAVRILNDDNCLGIGARHISISTVGIVDGIKRMASDMPQINLAISLHAANDRLRQSLMPINRKYPLARVMAAAGGYIAMTNRKLMFEYIMIKDVNDTVEHAKELAGLLKHKLYFVNLILCNPTGIFEPSSPNRLKKFKDILEKAGIQALARYRFGQDVSGACGQLAGDKKQ